ncbi:phosphoesterase [Pseudoalteromonas phage H101]|uniref:Calcineurin-like phosphoesterase domain-containing protein n=1 Tax=Pseudoalteromonas phage H101 TaxID=1654919 RepID=A0A0H4INE2_9CAUD|nr:phosphoesterase [Pseudoalteromonas phage H101]AKO61109.1 hypothetical protein [Pseudoalteromonas phage H101]
MSALAKEERHLFIADCHFGDTPVRRGMRTQFSDDEEHNNVIHSNILEVASTQKTLWLLGDNFTKPKEFWRLSEYAKAFQQLQLLMGNHCHTGLPRYALQFKNVNVFGVVQKFGLWLTHVPVPDYELYRGNCIHGHLHNEVVFDRDYEEDERYFCVSCENVDYKPISLAEIKRIRGWE